MILTHSGCSEGQRVAHRLGIQRREETLGVGVWLQESPQLEGTRWGGGQPSRAPAWALRH